MRTENTQEKIDKLKFLVEETYIAGYLSRLNSLEKHIEAFFGDIDGEVIHPARCISLAYEDSEALREAYLSLPWLDLVYLPENKPRDVYYTPLVIGKEILVDKLRRTMPRTLRNPNFKNNSYYALQRELSLARVAAYLYNQNIGRLESEIKRETGEMAPEFNPILDIRRRGYREE